MNLELRIQEIGEQLLAATSSRKPWPFSKAWLDDKAMSLTMKDSNLKAQLFRFVDALPGLKTNSSIVQHLHEYLDPVSTSMPFGTGLVLDILPRNKVTDFILAAVAKHGAHRLANRFIAGHDLNSVVRSIEKLHYRGLDFTVDLLGEAIISNHEANAYQAQYIDLITGLAGVATEWDKNKDVPPVNVSIKLSALVNRFDPSDQAGTIKAVSDRLRPILRLAMDLDVFINIDMEQYAYKNTTLAIFKSILLEDEFKNWKNVGIAIQAYLLDTNADLNDLNNWVIYTRKTPVWIRLVKGAYWDFEAVNAAQNGWPTPVFTTKSATDANYELLSKFLIDNYKTLRPAFASHNVRSIANIMAYAEQSGLNNYDIEFQMLFGMAEPLKDAVADRGYRVRVYAPFGQLLPGMAYLVRRLLENTSNQSFVRAGFLEGAAAKDLLMPPSFTVETSNLTKHGFKNEPLSDFSREGVRMAMQAALDVKLTNHCPLLVNNEPFTTEKRVQVYSPSDNRYLGNSCCAGVYETNFAIASAQAAFGAWRDTPVETRCNVLEKAACLISSRKFELAALIVHESGKSPQEADADVAETIDFCRYYAAEMRELSKARNRNVPGENNSLTYEARGVTVVISPWNFPLAIMAGMTVAALVAGNTVVVKPAEQSPLIAYEFIDILVQAGAPPGTVTYLPGYGEEIGPTLVEHKDVATIAFTGSKQVGLNIHKRAAALAGEVGDEVKRVICEMGGKNSIIVDSDADLDEAVLGVLGSAFGYQGQKCSACSKVIVVGDIYDTFIKRLVGATNGLTVGPAYDTGSAIGPVISDESRSRILSFIEQAKAEGFTKLSYPTSPVAVPSNGHYVVPHIFETTSDSVLAKEEVFGPVLAVIRSDSIENAIKIVNSTQYALTGGIYSRSPVNITLAKKTVRVGNFYINRKITGALVDRQPFGGFKMSGIGSKAGGPDYLKQFMVPRCVTENTLRHGFTPDGV